MSLANLLCAVYARASTAMQREASIEDQVRRCIQEIERQGGLFRPENVFKDYAVSGTVIHRPAFDAMLVKIERREIEVVVIEDVSRLSRDFVDAGLIFKRLQYFGVRLIGIADGLDTLRVEAKTLFQFKGIIADQFIDQLRDKTIRGMQGRHLAGMSTGGLPYGFVSAEVCNSFGKSIGFEIRIDDTADSIVRRIFSDRAAGKSLREIAAGLNREGLDPPRAKKRTRKPGWVDTGIREMLRNPKYVGEWSFGKTQWVKHPDTRKRLPRLRSEAEVLHQHRPELRIVDHDTWNEVQTGFELRKHEGSRAAKRTYLLSGLLRCGVCNSPMTINGGGAGKRYYSCSLHRNRGTCSNALSVPEPLVREKILDAIRMRLDGREGMAHIRKRIAERLGEVHRLERAELDERHARLSRTEDRIRGLIAFIADGDRSEYVVQTLHDLENQAKAEKVAIAEIEAQSRTPIRLPSDEEVSKRVADLGRLLSEDINAGREALRALLRDGIISMVPGNDGIYMAKCSLLPFGILIGTPKAEKPPGLWGGFPRRLVAGTRNDV